MLVFGLVLINFGKVDEFYYKLIIYIYLGIIGFGISFYYADLT